MRSLQATPAAVILTLILAFSSTGCGGNGAGQVSGGRNAVLIIIDTLRDDHLGINGYHRDTTPTLDSLASAGILYTNAQAQSSWTLPATASILTGLTPREHGAVRTGAITYGLAPELPTLQGFLHSRGWKTGGFFNVLFLSEDFGFHRGFDHFDCQGVANRLSLRDARGTVDDVLEWLEGLGPEENFLAVVHIYDPHIPYAPPAPWNTLYTDPAYTGDCDSEWGNVLQMNAVNDGDSTISPDGLSNLIGLYDGEIAYTDHEVGRFLSALRSMGMADSTVVVVVSDHGEEFLEHNGIEHGRTLYQEVTHVPLILSGPGVPEGDIRELPVAQTDLAPTVIRLLGLEPPTTMGGRDILQADLPEYDIPAGNLLWCAVQQASVRRGDLKIIWSTDGSEYQVFDLSTDPGEYAPEDSGYSELLEAVEYYWATPPACSAPEVPFEESMNRQLRDLGYIR